MVCSIAKYVGKRKEVFFPKGDFMGMKKHSRQCACDRKKRMKKNKNILKTKSTGN